MEGIEPDKVMKIIEAIDSPQIRTKIFNVPLYCRPLRLSTPTKEKENKENKLKTKKDDAVHLVHPQANIDIDKKTSPIKTPDRTSPANNFLDGEDNDNNDEDSFSTPSAKSKLPVKTGGKHKKNFFKQKSSRNLHSFPDFDSKKLKSVKVTQVVV